MVLDKCKEMGDHDFADALVWLCDVGMRYKTEFLKFTLDNVDFKKNHVYFYRPKTNVWTKVPLTPRARDIALRLNQGSEMNLFLLQSAKDDDWLRDDEFEAWKESWEFRSASPINKFMAADNEKDKKTREDLSEMTREYAQNYMKYNDFINGEGTLTIGDDTYDNFSNLNKEDAEKAAV